MKKIKLLILSLLSASFIMACHSTVHINSLSEIPQTEFSEIKAIGYQADNISFAADWTGNYEIYQLKNSEITQLTDNNSYDINPLPDSSGENLLFESDRRGKWGIYLMNISDKAVKEFSSSYDRLPSWSPDYKYISFISKRNNQWQVYLMDKNGNNQHLIGTGLYPDWSSDSRYIAYTDRSLNHKIVIKDRNSNLIREFDNKGTFDLEPAWSPDNQKIAFREAKGQYVANLAIINSDGSGRKLITDFPEYEKVISKPQWSPDNQKIVFLLMQPVGSKYYPHLFMINSDGTGLKELAPGFSIYDSPTWISDNKLLFYAKNGSKWGIYQLNPQTNQYKEVFSR